MIDPALSEDCLAFLKRHVPAERFDRFLHACSAFKTVLYETNRTLNLTILMVLHDLNLAARCSHRLAAVKNARIRYCGPPAEIIRPEVLEDVFEIKAEIIDGPDHIPCFIPVASCKKGGDGK